MSIIEMIDWADYPAAVNDHLSKYPDDPRGNIGFFVIWGMGAP